MNFIELIEDAKKRGCSDVHITVGIPPKMRINGSLVNMSYPCLLPEDTSKIISEFMNKKQQEQLAPVGLIETAFLFLPHTRTTTEKSTKGYTINHEKELQNRNKMCAGRLYPRKR